MVDWVIHEDIDIGVRPNFHAEAEDRYLFQLSKIILAMIICIEYLCHYLIIVYFHN